MSQQDARFEDADQNPLRLRALDGEDLNVISAMLQDAVLPATEISWQPKKRRIALLANRFRWEDSPLAERQKRRVERVQAMLVVHDVLKISSSGVDLKDKDQVLSVLSVTFEPEADAAGRVLITLAGDSAISCAVECLEVTLTDVTRPYLAPSKTVPQHDLS